MIDLVLLTLIFSWLIWFLWWARPKPSKITATLSFLETCFVLYVIWFVWNDYFNFRPEF